MSERKRRRTSISSALAVEPFNMVATTLRITEVTCKIRQMHECFVRFIKQHFQEKQKEIMNVTRTGLTRVLNLDCGVRLNMGFVNYLCAHLLSQNLMLEAGGTHQSHIQYTDTKGASLLWRERKMLCYLVQSVVGRDGHSVGVQHEPLSQESEEAVRVHDLHLPPVDKHTITHTQTWW